MTNYNNKRKYKKQKAKERARKAKQARRSKAIKAENRDKKAIELIQWKNRSRIAPYKKPKEEDNKRISNSFTSKVKGSGGLPKRSIASSAIFLISSKTIIEFKRR